MPVNLVPVDTWPANFQAAADGDAVSQATRVNVMQEGSDASLYLYNRSIEASGGAYLIPINPNSLYPAAWAARWAFDPANNGWVNFNIGGTDEVVIPLPAVTDTSFSSVTIVVHGDPNVVGPHAALPASMPRLTLFSFDGAGGAGLTNVGSQVDTSAGVAAYETLHTITYTPGAAQVVSSTLQYALSVRGESGANSIANALVIFGAYMTVVPT